MSSIFVVLLLMISTLYAGTEEREGRSSKRVFVAMKRMYWADQQEEAADKRRKKYRLGNTANKDSSPVAKRQLIPVKMSVLEDKIRLSYEPAAYKAEKNLHFVGHQDKSQLISQAREPDFLSHKEQKSG